MTRNRLSGQRAYPRILKRCHHSIIPRFGFRQRRSRISFNLPRYAGSGDCETVWSGRQEIPHLRPSESTRSICTIGSCYTSACLIDAMFLHISHQRMPVSHVLCYTLTHKGCGSFRLEWLCDSSTITDSVPSFLFSCPICIVVLYDVEPSINLNCCFANCIIINRIGIRHEK